MERLMEGGCGKLELKRGRIERDGVGSLNSENEVCKVNMERRKYKEGNG